ncbi:hypothetical protein [Streptomyces aurantiogriseus]|uniref:Uncharacterized protein n=1 Tax=Streptomyces aurantiogriseus TaxID=66870 RepID=A0A918KZB5_9ACTN|nr:hypothetical protein [Streptomyces aurantiogriseus]GGR55073.1 hypothetical protein GCM10010251_85120 [Streptomyces aurantiogriseus]
MTPRLLALRALGLGDRLAGIPALRGIRRALPEHQADGRSTTGIAEKAALSPRPTNLTPERGRR